MKKQVLFMIMLFSLVSCTEDVKFNNPSFQGVKDNVFWRAVDSKASKSANGSLIIEAYSGNEVITLITPFPPNTVSQEDQYSYITYFLGTSASKTATYVLTNSDDTITFSTGNGIGEGQIVITDYDEANKTVSGTFRFNAENIYNNPLAGSLLNFQQGVFYKVPIM
jgi:hypothetical protein